MPHGGRGFRHKWKSTLVGGCRREIWVESHSSHGVLRQGRRANPWLEIHTRSGYLTHPQHVSTRHAWIVLGQNTVSADRISRLERTQRISSKRFTTLIAQTFPVVESSKTLPVLRANSPCFYSVFFLISEQLAQIVGTARSISQFILFYTILDGQSDMAQCPMVC